jgi:hypothetical protein
MANGNGFRKSIAYMVMIAAITYAGFATVALALLMYFGADLTKEAIVWSFLSNMISTVLGVLLSKFSTIVDHQFGASEVTPSPPPQVQGPTGTTAVG